MNRRSLDLLLLWLVREVARLHAENAAILQVVEELRVNDERLDSIDPRTTQKEAWQRFYEKLEDLDPELASLVDSRPPEAF